MLNSIWAAMIILGVVWGSFQGKLPEVTEGALNGAGDAVALCITMAGVMAFWMGIMEIAKRSGVISSLNKLVGPAVRFLFPGIPKGHSAAEEIGTNLIANMLGLGWAATPAGLRAMKELEGLEEDRRRGRLPGRAVPRGTASDEMCMFLILNISSLQLIPVNMIAYRSQYGSAAPAAVLAPALLATLVSTLAGILAGRLLAGRRRF